MSQENVETVRAAVDAWNRGDWDAVLKDAAPSFEFDFTRSFSPGRGLYSLDQMGEYFRQLTEGWESLRLEADEFIEAGGQVVMPMGGTGFEPVTSCL
jgi:ketosteroid isomerase-like protein